MYEVIRNLLVPGELAQLVDNLLPFILQQHLLHLTNKIRSHATVLPLSGLMDSPITFSLNAVECSLTTLGVRKDAVLALLPLPPGGEETRRVGRVPLPFNEMDGSTVVLVVHAV